jgi:hypothetical protein
VHRLLQTIATQPGVDGIMTYTLKSALPSCPDAPPLYEGAGLQLQLGCIVRDAYRTIAAGN